MRIVIANFLALIASLIMVYTGTILIKKKIIFLEIIQISLFTISELILGGISGAVVNSISVLVNVLCYNDKLTVKAKAFVTVLTIVTSIFFNDFTVLGIALTVSMLIYLWCMSTKNVKIFKILLALYMVVWLLYDYSIKAYTAAIFDGITVLTNTYALIKLIIRDKKGV